MAKVNDLKKEQTVEDDEICQILDEQESVWEIHNLRGIAAIFHDDQRIGLPRKELNAIEHSSVDYEELKAFRMKPVVDSLEGNMLIHPLTTPVIEVDKSNKKARGVWWSIGIEGLDRFHEKPIPIISLGMVPGVHIKENDEWRILWGVWQRTTKNDYKQGWINNMIPTNTRPPLTEEQDSQMFGKFAYRKNRSRFPIPAPPKPNTWEEYPDEIDRAWLEKNI